MVILTFNCTGWALVMPRSWTKTNITFITQKSNYFNWYNGGVIQNNVARNDIKLWTCQSTLKTVVQTTKNGPTRPWFVYFWSFKQQFLQNNDSLHRYLNSDRWSWRGKCWLLDHHHRPKSKKKFFISMRC